MKHVLVAILLIITVSYAAADESICNTRLFHVEKSTNSNIVIYEANLESNGTLDASAPMDIYWIREDNRKKALGWLEKKLAYGVQYVNSDMEHPQFYVSAVPQKILEIDIENGCAMAITEIAGSEAILNKVFVELTGSGVSSKVTYIELTGIDRRSNTTVTERIYN